MVPNVLTRRRSSEQGNQSTVPRSPTLSRLKSVLRGVDVLFSVIAHVEPTPNSSTTTISPSASPPRPNIPRMPDFSTDNSPGETAGVRRLFSREWRNRGSAIPRLAVGAPAKQGSQLRLYQLVDYGSAGRMNVQRSWNVSDIRRIDGMGESVEQGHVFAFRFASTGKTFAWRTGSPHSRAVFLWSLLQACVSRLKRAPPVDGLRLLDLQTMAESSSAGGGSSSEQPDDGQLSSNFAGSEQSNVRLNSSFDELAESPSDHMTKSQRDGSSSVHDRHSSTSHSHHTRSSRLNRTPEQIGQDQDASVSDRLPSDVLKGIPGVIRIGSSPEGERDVLLGRDGRPPIKKVTRTLSEPRGAMLGISDDGSDESEVDAPARRADTIAQGQAAADRHLKDMNLDERAFLAAAKRLGGKRSFEMGRGDVIDRIASAGSDPRAVGYPNRAAGDISTSRLVAELRILQENKLFKLSADEKNDLEYVLQLFSEQNEKLPLSEFGSWCSDQIQALEVENTADVVRVEQLSLRKDNGESSEDVAKKQLEMHERPRELLVEAMAHAGTWLQNCEIALAPYASLAEDINNDILMLQLQRKNASDLASKLDQVLEAISFSEEEETLIKGIDTADFSTNRGDMENSNIQGAIALLTSKSEALAKLSKLSDMSAVSQVRQKATSKRERASSILLPTLKRYLDDVYQSERSASRFIISGRQSFKTDRDLAGFRNGSSCLLACGMKNFSELIQHYHAVSKRWINSLIVSSMADESHNETHRIGREESPIKTFVDVILYGCILETIRVHRLFESSATKESGNYEFKKMVKDTIGSGEIFDEYVAKLCEEQGLLESAAFLHSSCILDCMAEVMQECTDGDIDSIISRVESAILVDGESDSSILEQESVDEYLDTDIFVENSRKSLSLSFHGRVPENEISKDNDLVREALSTFEAICRDMSRKCEHRAQKHVKAIISTISSSRDISMVAVRDNMFAAVKNGIDICVSLASLKFEGPEKVKCKDIAGKKCMPLCADIVATTVRSTEDTAAKALESTRNLLKLQCHGYIATKLREASSEQYLVEMIHASNKIRKHVLLRWAEKEIYEKELAPLKLKAPGHSTESPVEYEERLSRFDGDEIASSITIALELALGQAITTVVLVPVLIDLTSFIKGKIDELLRSLRKDRDTAHFRPRLSSLARSIMTSVRESFETLKHNSDSLSLDMHTN